MCSTGKLAFMTSHITHTENENKQLRSEEWKKSNQSTIFSFFFLNNWFIKGCWTVSLSILLNLLNYYLWSNKEINTL